MICGIVWPTGKPVPVLIALTLVSFPAVSLFRVGFVYTECNYPEYAYGPLSASLQVEIRVPATDSGAVGRSDGAASSPAHSAT